MKTLTPKQAEMLNFIIAYRTKTEQSPTLQEIANGLGFKYRSSAVSQLKNLERKKVIKRYYGAPRGIRILV